MKALSIRQPWAYLIIHGGKNIENRTWRTNVRGRVLVHASAGMTQDEYWEAAAFARNYDAHLPAHDELERGGIIGSVEITDCVSYFESPWFIGPQGFVLANPHPLPFLPLKGKLGFFEVGQ